jgi:heptosyltransferase-2
MRKRTMKRWLLVHRKLNLLRDEPDVVGRYFETAQALGIHDTGEAACLDLPPMPRERAIALAPGARHLTKRWPTKYFVALAKHYAANGYAIRLFGSSLERELCERVALGVGGTGVRNFAGELSLSGTALELAKCAAAVTNDSGLMHLASAVGTPTLAVFGPTVKGFGFAPRAQSARIIENAGLYCRPCTTHGSERCPEGHFRCMLEVSPETVAISLDEALEYYPQS